MSRYGLVLALAAMVVMSLACGWLGKLKGNANNGAVNNRADNSTNNSPTPTPNNNGADNSNHPDVSSGFVTRFVVSRDREGAKETANFSTEEAIFIVFQVKGMPAAKGLKGKLVADAVKGIRTGASLESEKRTREGDSVADFMYFTPPPTLWHPGDYHVELTLMNNDGTETVLRSKKINIHILME